MRRLRRLAAMATAAAAAAAASAMALPGERTSPTRARATSSPPRPRPWSSPPLGVWPPGPPPPRPVRTAALPPRPRSPSAAPVAQAPPAMALGRHRTRRRGRRCTSAPGPCAGATTRSRSPRGCRPPPSPSPRT
ncbi:hypothetical protein BU14_0260s0015 [Porphyra umbilicalis]|uniref:Uncharacterized protein n=1 Tax=Porphyra umbilicalis TaxID=2786 RepID=A0A1X6P2A4_PORUM|nr:hypothetical protein BU14_0260s0015 [Porphyra umbilicalis]|eukprot:OSX74947.1 hypothetical protein BU14_0260s0015 [Porphyra umbilicalis]